MAHEIDFSNNRANVAFTGSRSEVWHHLGAEIPEGASIETWTKEAGLNWEVFESVVQYQTIDGAKQFDDKRVLFRSDTKEPLSVVSSGYCVVQPMEVMEFFSDLVALHGFKLSSAGSLFGGKRFWCLADIGKTTQAVPDDITNGYLLLVTSVDGTLSTQARFTSTRVVCNNLLTVALNENSKNVVKKTHASAFDPTSVKIDLGLVDQAWDTFSNNIKKLTEIEITTDFARSYIEKKCYAPNLEADKQSTQTYNKVQKLLNLYQNGVGAEFAPGTTYQLLQGFTQAYTHGLREKQDPSRRFWEGSFGTADALKSEVYSDMLALAA